MMGRILCIDYGERRIGLALSDETKTIAQGLATLLVQVKSQKSRSKSQDGRTGASDACAAIARIVAEQEVERIILGNPLSQQGGETRRSEQVREFKAALEKAVNVPIELVDERFTTVLARQYLSESYSKVRAQKHPVDKVAAVILLEDYLEFKRKEPLMDADEAI
jgi:putative Holliday junction resolvase